MEREKLINYAKDLKKHLGDRFSSTQIRKYMDTVKNAENFEEYVIYLEYQFTRNKPQNPQEALKIIRDIYKKSREDKTDWRENIAYTFGITWRLKKIEERRRSGQR